MVNQARGQGLALILTLLIGGMGLGQDSAAVVNPAAPAVPPLWRLDPLGTSAAPCTHGPPACAPYEDHNGPLLVGDPLLDGPAGVGWLGAVDVGVFAPHVRNNVAGQALLSNGTTSLVSLPSAPMNWAVSPRFEVGYRFGEGAGELILAYRFVVSQGDQTMTGIDPATLTLFTAPLHSRLDMQIADLDYGSYERSLGPLCDMKWRVGLRLADIYFDSRAANATLDLHTSSRFIGVGPHVSLDLRRNIVDTGLALFARIDASSPIGRTAQTFEEVTTVPGASAGGAGTQGTYYPPLSLAVQLGVSWLPGRPDGLRVTAGYTYEHWWDTGTLFSTPPLSRADLFLQGVFLRAEWNY
jgi:hypothetical protein